MRLAEWTITLAEALAVGLFWGGVYYAVDEFFHPTDIEKYAIAIAAIVLWLMWAVKKDKS